MSSPPGSRPSRWTPAQRDLVVGLGGVVLVAVTSPSSAGVLLPALAVAAAAAHAAFHHHPTVAATGSVLACGLLVVVNTLHPRYDDVDEWVFGAACALMVLTAFRAAVHEVPTSSGLLAVGGAGVATVAALASTGLALSPSLLLALTSVAGGWAVGRWLRSERRYVAEAVERARLAELQTALEREAAIVAERTRMAREMHDVISHALAVMIAQADGAAAVLAGREPRARAAAEAIATTGRLAYTDLAGLLGVLAADRIPGDDALHPQPGLDRVPELVAGLAASGRAASFVEVGTPGPVSAGVELALYRIVQEALTNVVKHAPAASTTDVTLTWTPDHVSVDVRDTPDAVTSSAPTPRRPQERADLSGGPGLGLASMTQRAVGLRGSLQHAPTPDGGFCVRAELPRTDGAGAPS